MVLFFWCFTVFFHFEFTGVAEEEEKKKAKKKSKEKSKLKKGRKRYLRILSHIFVNFKRGQGFKGLQKKKSTSPYPILC